MTALLALKAAWEFVKKHAVAIGVILVGLVGFLFGVSVKKRPVLVQGEDPLKQEIEKQTQAAVRIAQEQHDVLIQQAEQEATEQNTAVVQQEQDKTTQIQNDVSLTNDYLQDVSKQIRSRPLTIPGLRVCSDIEEGQAIVRCECGAMRQQNRPHGYRRS